MSLMLLVEKGYSTTISMKSAAELCDEGLAKQSWEDGVRTTHPTDLGRRFLKEYTARQTLWGDD